MHTSGHVALLCSLCLQINMAPKMAHSIRRPVVRKGQSYRAKRSRGEDLSPSKRSRREGSPLSRDTLTAMHEGPHVTVEKRLHEYANETFMKHPVSGQIFFAFVSFLGRLHCQACGVDVDHIHKGTIESHIHGAPRYRTKEG